jgi:hypothetical protein
MSPATDDSRMPDSLATRDNNYDELCLDPVMSVLLGKLDRRKDSDCASAQ